MRGPISSRVCSCWLTSPLRSFELQIRARPEIHRSVPTDAAACRTSTYALPSTSASAPAATATSRRASLSDAQAVRRPRRAPCRRLTWPPLSPACPRERAPPADARRTPVAARPRVTSGVQSGTESPTGTRIPRKRPSSAGTSLATPTRVVARSGLLRAPVPARHRLGDAQRDGGGAPLESTSASGGR